ncbi:hypothetical protein N7490_000817 [Penicillium lividum]|nr:hypothetical protein N7490_000817 [Penicillium lividum]
MEPIAVQFYSQRAKVLNNINRYRDLIATVDIDAYPGIAYALEDDMHTLEKMVKIPVTRFSGTIDSCLEERVDRVNYYLEDIKLSLECLGAEDVLREAFLLISTYIGMLRLVEIDDYHADEMALQAMEITERYLPRRRKFEFYHYLKKMWKELTFCRITCSCLICQNWKR